MSLNIHQWLAKHNLQISQDLALEAKLSAISFHIFEEMEARSFSALEICCLADVLELPAIRAIVIAKPIARIALLLLQILSRKKQLTLPQITWLTFQIAYLNALQELLERETWTKKPWLNRCNLTINSFDRENPNHLKLQKSLKTLRSLQLNVPEAEQTLSLVSESLLLQQMNACSIAWLIANSASETEASLTAQRLVHGFSGYLLETIVDSNLPLDQLQQFFRLGNFYTVADRHRLTDSLAIERDREKYRAGLLKALSEPLLGESFCLSDIYIPLEGIPLDPAFSDSEREPIEIENWLLDQLSDTKTIAAIEAESGGGKTGFCQIFASWLAQTLYPQWMPIFIQLKNVSLGANFQQTLGSVLPAGRFSDSDGWFGNNSPPCLLILDGLDELPNSRNRSISRTTAFLDQLLQFHYRQIDSNGKPRHKIILTTAPAIAVEKYIRRYRPGSLFPLPINIEKIRIQPLTQDKLQFWFKNWAKLQSKTIAQNYFAFLKQKKIFHQNPTPEIAELALRPLTIYILGILYRDGWLDPKIFRSHSSPNALKLEIYDKLTCWLLGRDNGRSLDDRESASNLLAGQNPETLRELMQETALKLLDRNYLMVDRPLPALFFSPLYLPVQQKEAEANPYPVTFSHSQLGAYLAAEEIATKLKYLTQTSLDLYGEIISPFDSPAAIAQYLYSLLGGYLLSPEIQEMVIARLVREELRNNSSFSFAVLFEKLLAVYRGYCQGRWLDSGLARSAASEFELQSQHFNALQVDATLGVNIFLLLCLISQVTVIPFCACGNPNRPEDFDAERLLAFLTRSSIVSPLDFPACIRHCFKNLQLSGACLNGAMLADVDLEQVNLSIAELVGINLSGANLRGANLSWANLERANLTGADLSDANLEGANLSGANLFGVNLALANLSNTYLGEAQLDEDSREIARHKGAIFSRAEFELYNQSLLFLSETAKNLSVKDLSKVNPQVSIQMVEGEPFIKNPWDESLATEYRLETGEQLLEERDSDLTQKNVEKSRLTLSDDSDGTIVF
jgi:uncharacterized protein YjbI with pentapeptide repeats